MELEWKMNLTLQIFVAKVLRLYSDKWPVLELFTGRKDDALFIRHE